MKRRETNYVLLVNRAFALLRLRRTRRLWMWMLQMRRLRMQMRRLRSLLLIFVSWMIWNSGGGPENGRPAFSMCGVSGGFSDSTEKRKSFLVASAKQLALFFRSMNQP